MQISIYGLVDPETDEIRYVGKTKQPLNKRLSQHIASQPKHNTYKFNWIAKLKKNNLKPLIILIETCDPENWVEREKYWINELDNLTNLTQGGEDGLFFTDEILQKISMGVKRAWDNPDYRQRHSDKMKEYWSNPEHRKAHSLKVSGATRTDDHREKISNSKKELWLDDEYRDTMSKQSSELWLDDDYREKTLKFLQSKEYRDTVSQRFKGKPKSDLTKQRMSDGRKNKQKIIVDGIIYESITEASKLIPINRDKLKRRLKSKNFTTYEKLAT